MARIVDRYLDQATRTLDVVARFAEVSPPEDLPTFMQGTWEAYEYFDTLYYLDASSKIKQLIPPDPRYLGLDMSNLPYFQHTGEKQNLVISRPFISLRTGNPTVYLVRQLSQGGQMVGELSLGSLQDEITRSRGARQDVIFMMDQSGMLLAHPSFNLVKQQTNQSDLEIFRRGLGGDATLVYEYAGTMVLGSAIRSERAGWVVVDQVPLSVSLRPYGWALGLILLASLAIWLTLAWSLRNQLEQHVAIPLTQLSRGTGALANGDFSRGKALAFIPAAFAELTALAADFQYMSDALQARQAALQESEKRYRSLFDRVPIGLYRTRPAGQILDVNPAFAHILGYPDRETLLAVNAADLYANPDDRNRWCALIEREGTVRDFQVQFRRHDGTIIWVRNSGQGVRNNQGQVLYYEGSLEDITERKRAEAEINKLTRAVEQSPAAIVITDTAGNIEYVNPRFTQITGYTSAEVLGQNPRILKSGETPPEEYQRLWEIITHGDVWRGEFHNKKKSGDLYWESASISPVIDTQGAITHFVAVKEDITVRKQTEEALGILNEELELRVRHRTAELDAANKELQEFAYIVSHDLKAPLRGINRLTQWLRGDYAGVLDAQGQEHLDLLGQQVKRMDTMIDGILRYSKAGHGGERKESIALNTLVAQVIEMLMLPAHITIECENTLPVIQGDPIQLMQVFQNLLSNAVKFLDKPIGKITVASEDADEEWIFRVQDNGPGIEARHHDHIFKIFQSCIPRDERESNGIGLAVVKKIVELYGGRVWVESTPGHGSCFSFTWPKQTSGED